MKTKILLSICFFISLATFAQNPMGAIDKENFKTIALSADQTGMPVIKKWVTPIRYKIAGSTEEYMVKEVDSTFSQLKALTGLDISKTTDDDEANFLILFGKVNDFAEAIPAISAKNFNQFGGYYYRFNGKGEIYKAISLITTENYSSHQDVRHVLRKGIVRQLGFFKPLETKPNSLFYSQNNNMLKFNSYDSALIRLLYSPRFTPGMNLPQVEEVLSKI